MFETKKINVTQSKITQIHAENKTFFDAARQRVINKESIIGISHIEAVNPTLLAEEDQQRAKRKLVSRRKKNL